MVLLPVHGLMTQLAASADFMEVACAPTSSLSEMMMEKGFVAKRINYKNGFDLESRQGTQMLRHEMRHESTEGDMGITPVRQNLALG